MAWCLRGPRESHATHVEAMRGIACAALPTQHTQTRSSTRNAPGASAKLYKRPRSISYRDHQQHCNQTPTRWRRWRAGRAPVTPFTSEAASPESVHRGCKKSLPCEPVPQGAVSNGLEAWQGLCTGPGAKTTCLMPHKQQQCSRWHQLLAGSSPAVNGNRGGVPDAPLAEAGGETRERGITHLCRKQQRSRAG